MADADSMRTIEPYKALRRFSPENTHILADLDWADILTPEDKRGLTPLFWAHLLPYGEVKLNMTRRLLLSDGETPSPDDETP